MDCLAIEASACPLPPRCHFSVDCNYGTSASAFPLPPRYPFCRRKRTKHARPCAPNHARAAPLSLFTSTGLSSLFTLAWLPMTPCSSSHTDSAGPDREALVEAPVAAEEAAAVVVLARCRVPHLLLRLLVLLNCCCWLWPLIVRVCLLLPGAAE